MNKKYYVINKKSEIKKAENYIRSKISSKEFERFVRSELSFDKRNNNKGASDYLEISKKFGFNWEENADIGLMQYDYKANLIMKILKSYARELVDDIGFPIFEVRGSNIFDLSHPVVQAYSKLYGERLYQFKSGKKDVVMSYDASYPQFNLAGKYQLSEGDLPFSHFSISDCYRHEQSGECMLLYRMRRFFMPDVHPYFKDLNQAFRWFGRIENQILSAGRAVNCNYQVLVEVSSLENWKKYKDEIKELFKGREVLVEVHNDGIDRYWILNVDYKIVDKFKQSREIACIQIDIGNAKRLGIKYIDKDNKSHNPVIIHSAVPGGFERYLYMIFDNFEERFPLWLHPIQLRLIPVGKKYLSECERISDQFKNKIRIDIDDKNESVSKRVKRSREELIPYEAIIGEKEKKGDISELNRFVRRIIEESNGFPFIKRSWPVFVSKQVR